METSLLLMKQQWQHGWVTNYYYHYYLCNHALQRAEYIWMLQMAVLTQTWNLNPLRLLAHSPRTVCPRELQVGLTLWKQCADITNGALCSKRDTGSDSPAALANIAAFAGALIIKLYAQYVSGYEQKTAPSRTELWFVILMEFFVFLEANQENHCLI